MSPRRGINISDLPQHYQDQINRQLAAEKAQKKATPSNAVSAASESISSALGTFPDLRSPPRDKELIRVPKKREPNKTEASYNTMYLKGQGLYEAITLKLAGGSRYTPDYVTWEGDRMICHEVKGGYKLGSHGRAVTAFREAVATFPHIDFIWAVKTKDGWKTQNGRRPSTTSPQ